jgi:hypothetical protein
MHSNIVLVNELKLTLEKHEGAIKNRQSRRICNIGELANNSKALYNQLWKESLNSVVKNSSNMEKTNYHLSPCNITEYKKKPHMTLEIQILAWKIQKYGEVQLVNGKKIQIISKCLPTMFDCIFWFKIQGFQSGPVPGTFTRLRSCIGIVPAEITEPPKISGGQNHKYDGR